jgi:hypothetical protein
MKNIIFPIALVAGVVGLLSVQAMPVTTLSASTAGLVAADTVAPDTTKKVNVTSLI